MGPETVADVSLTSSFSSLPILDLSLASNPAARSELLRQLHDALFNIGFLYIVGHGVPQEIIDGLSNKLPALFDLPAKSKQVKSKINSPHFLGYSGFAEEKTLGEKDLREQWDLATELPLVWRADGERDDGGRDFTRLFWRLRGPNQWPSEDEVPGFREAFMRYLDAVSDLSYRFVHLIEEAFGIPIGTFDDFFLPRHHADGNSNSRPKNYMQPQHRVKLIKYPPSPGKNRGQGVGAHKDSSGWLTFLYQVGEEEGLEVLNGDGDWIPAVPIKGSFVVNFGNAFEAATEGAVKATVHRVKAPAATSRSRYSVPFFQGLPLDLTVSEIRSYIPEEVRTRRKKHDEAYNDPGKANAVASFLDPRWDSLGESQLRKWIRSHEDVARQWYGDEVTDFYLQ